jgi:hypothetical protein
MASLGPPFEIIAFAVSTKPRTPGDARKGDTTFKPASEARTFRLTEWSEPGAVRLGQATHITRKGP